VRLGGVDWKGKAYRQQRLLEHCVFCCCRGASRRGHVRGDVIAAGYMYIVVAALSAALVAAYVSALTIITCNESDKKLIETLAEAIFVHSYRHHITL